jgi:hypothetical protein
MTFLCLAWAVTPRLTRDIVISWKTQQGADEHSALASKGRAFSRSAKNTS